MNSTRKYLARKLLQLSSVCFTTAHKLSWLSYKVKGTK
jgi:hypothetical protein